MLHRLFPGGSLKCVAGKSPRNMRRHTARVLMIDEVDAIEVSAEGDPVALAERRTMTFDDRKIIVGSTPISAETSHVVRSYLETDRRVFEVPCPACGAYTEIMWRHIEYDPAKPSETVGFTMPALRGADRGAAQAAMVRAGQWKITAPEVLDHAGFRLNSLVSLLANCAWGKLAAEYERVKDDDDRLKVFTNTLLGEPWQEAADQIDQIGAGGPCGKFWLRPDSDGGALSVRWHRLRRRPARNHDRRLCERRHRVRAGASRDLRIHFGWGDFFRAGRSAEAALGPAQDRRRRDRCWRRRPLRHGDDSATRDRPGASSPERASPDLRGQLSR